MYTLDAVLRKKAFDVLERVAILLDIVRKVRQSKTTNELLQGNVDKVFHETPLWFAEVLELVELVRKPSKGGPPSLLEQSDADIACSRPDMKLLISSAKLDVDKFSDFFHSTLIFRYPGRRYPVEILHTSALEADYLDAAIVTALQIHVQQLCGDILIFLISQEEIEASEELLKHIA
ncbi:pre-mRNA-splicing factor ATP-dependent RNA helicase DEAH1-like [Eucalyptus grandis]|uniref:pre-mRNA-splicing factor ATP-dependent RNA helicase DEAH1-like n=1 Tax=Eucalyptus grandis TaxID=71139 RepID=UPI000526DC35|nr:pre-mRNA-splicing factor ATP-dependent RNA helicase DEAH1-like [Eucalyptus grandis]XP_039159218.1 pre-mRNA-splicing factor ATP-dependent RNA helicase DEAH1-like [Eucalyptus grandis]